MAKKNRKSRKSEQPEQSAKKICKPPPSDMPEISVQTLFTNYRAIRDVLTDAFQGADRVNLETSWGKYMIFMTKRDDREFYFVHTGCTCNLNCMPKNMEYFPNMHEMLKFIVNGSVFEMLKNQPKPICCYSKCGKHLCELHDKRPKVKSN